AVSGKDRAAGIRAVSRPRSSRDSSVHEVVGEGAISNVDRAAVVEDRAAQRPAAAAITSVAVRAMAAKGPAFAGASKTQKAVPAAPPAPPPPPRPPPPLHAPPPPPPPPVVPAPPPPPTTKRPVFFRPPPPPPPQPPPMPPVFFAGFAPFAPALEPPRPAGLLD